MTDRAISLRRASEIIDKALNDAYELDIEEQSTSCFVAARLSGYTIGTGKSLWPLPPVDPEACDDAYESARDREGEGS